MLDRMQKAGTDIRFTYDHTGLRVKKTVNGVETKYTLNGKIITHVQKGDTHMHIFYDAQGRPSLLRHNGVDYAYLHNLQGDVTGLIDMDGVRVVEYTYDAWGKPQEIWGQLKNTIGRDNPFRHRGYVYDEETGLYYLRSRYYNPEWGRFLNADTLLGKAGAVLSHNVFAYCNNTPINMSDPSGHWPKWMINIANRINNFIKNANKVFDPSRVTKSKNSEGAPVWLVDEKPLGLQTIPPMTLPTPTPRPEPTPTPAAFSGWVTATISTSSGGPANIRKNTDMEDAYSIIGRIDDGTQVSIRIHEGYVGDDAWYKIIFTDSHGREWNDVGRTAYIHGVNIDWSTVVIP